MCKFVSQVVEDLQQHISMLSKLKNMWLQDVKISSSLVSTLLEPFVQDQLLLRMNHKLSIFLLYQLRCISWKWKAFLNSKIEWNALEFTRFDIPSYNVYYQQKKIPRKLRSVRFWDEVVNFDMLLVDRKWAL
jgi:hypothetical protein